MCKLLVILFIIRLYARFNVFTCGYLLPIELFILDSSFFRKMLPQNFRILAVTQLFESFNCFHDYSF